MLYVLIGMTLKKLELLSSNLTYATNVCALIKKKTSNNLNLIEIHTNINELLSHVLLVGQYDGVIRQRKVIESLVLLTAKAMSE